MDTPIETEAQLLSRLAATGISAQKLDRFFHSRFRAWDHSTRHDVITDFRARMEISDDLKKIDFEAAEANRRDQWAGLYGFQPTAENFRKLQIFRNSFQPQHDSLTAHFETGYLSQIQIPGNLDKAPSDFQAVAKGIQGFWNSSERFVAQMNRLKTMVSDLRVKNPDWSEAEALEIIRTRYEGANHFAPSQQAIVDIVPMKQWYELLRSGQLPLEPGGSHSPLPLEGENDFIHVHRNQMLLIMMEMAERPQNFVDPAGKRLALGDFYRLLGDADLNKNVDVPPLDPSRPSGTNHLWYHFFDRVIDRDHSDGVGPANPSNPRYFNLMWYGVTGFSSHS